MGMGYGLGVRGEGSNGRGEPGILKDCGYWNDMLHSFRDTAP
jgi:hypothetical protein